tara:strand:+ start:55 stop:813 length:759 start_codon:yes stop_codon:yes gene_type:complete
MSNTPELPPLPRQAAIVAHERIRLQAEPMPTPTPRRDPIAFGIKGIRGIIQDQKAKVKELEKEIIDLGAIKRDVKQELQSIDKDLAIEADRLEEVRKAKEMVASQLNAQSGLLLNNLATELEDVDPDAITFFLNLCAVEKQQLDIVADLQAKQASLNETINHIKVKKEKAKAELTTMERNIVSYQDCVGAMKSLKPQQCVVCLSAAASHALLPCGHRAICEQCSKNFGVGKACPVCRKGVDDVAKIYFDCPM